MTTQEMAKPNPEAMQARIEELARKTQLSPDELIEFIYLVWDKISLDEGDKDIQHDGQMKLPSRENPIILLKVGNPDEMFSEIIFLDNLSKQPVNESGEIVSLVEDTELKTQWKVGLFDSTYSELLQRRVLLDDENIEGVINAVDPLTPKECSGFPGKIYEAYQASQKPAS